MSSCNPAASCQSLAEVAATPGVLVPGPVQCLGLSAVLDSQQGDFGGSDLQSLGAVVFGAQSHYRKTGADPPASRFCYRGRGQHQDPRSLTRFEGASLRTASWATGPMDRQKVPNGATAEERLTAPGCAIHRHFQMHSDSSRALADSN